LQRAAFFFMPFILAAGLRIVSALRFRKMVFVQ